MKDRGDETKVRARSATITASGMSARFLKRNKGKDDEVDNESGDNQNSSSAKEKTAEEKERVQKDKAGRDPNFVHNYRFRFATIFRSIFFAYTDHKQFRGVCSNANSRPTSSAACEACSFWIKSER
jgi:hypothetical protein